MNGGSVVQQ